VKNVRKGLCAIQMNNIRISKEKRNNFQEWAIANGWFMIRENSKPYATSVEMIQIWLTPTGETIEIVI